MDHSFGFNIHGGVILRPHNGKFPSLAINDNDEIVELYQPYILSDEMHYKVGKQRSDGSLKMALSEVATLGQGRYPRVAINKESYVIVVYEGVIRRRVYYSIGKAYSP